MGLAEEIAIDVPALHLPLYVEGAASNGQEVPDVGANDLDGELDYAGSTQAWGYPSAVETESPSWEYRGYGESINGTDGHSRISVPHDASMVVSGDFACEAVVRPQSDIPAAGTFVLVQKQGSGGIALSTADSLATRLAGFCFDTAAELFVVSDLTFAVTEHLGEPFHVLVSRTGNTLAIRVNGELRNTKTVTSGLPTLSNSSPFRVHSDPGAYDCRYSNVAWYTHSVDGARALIHYEAMIAATLLNGVANATPSAVLYTDVEPDPVNYPFRHNWVEPLGERITFLTGLSTTRTGKEEANAARTKPRREIEFSQVIRDKDERIALRAKVRAYQDRKWFIPILEDREILTSPLSSGALSIPTSTEFKDYQAGAWIHLRELNTSGQITKSEYLQIQSFDADEVVPLTATVNDYAAGLSEVCPARRGYLPPSIQPRGHTAEVEDLNLVARLVAEDEPATPNRITHWTPTITYKGYEAYDLQEWQSNDWSELREYDIERPVEYVDFETGVFDGHSDTAGAAEAFSWSVLLKGKDKIAAFLGWFYYHAGSLVYLWVPSNQRDFTIVSASTNQLTVSGHVYTEDCAGSEARRDLAFVYNDNTMQLRRIDSSTTSGSNDVLTLNTTVPTQTNLRSVSFLKFCRIDADTLEKALYTDDVMRAIWRFRELLHSPD